DFLTLERMATNDDSAALIVHGVVENVRFTERDAWPLVIYDFVVSEVFKGEIEAPCRISVVQGGGFVRVESYIKKYGTKGLSEEDIERGYVGSYSVYFEKKMPETGDEYVLFLNPAQDEDAMAGAYYPHAMYHGKYIRDPETGLFARTTNETGEHFDWVEFDSETGQISGEEEQPMSLDTIRARLKTALEK
ncbi:MAG: hypothetical protein J6J21_05635, partial [Clostridia bacterium]|nr:hypothetical protein [Clostridia bacterium]